MPPPDGGAEEPAEPLPLPAEFLSALAGHETVRVTSRAGPVQGTVAAWFLILPPGVLYLYTHAFSKKADRWRQDPWVRLAVPRGGPAAEGVVHFVVGRDLDQVAEAVAERWAAAGTPTVEALRESLASGMHALVRVEGRPSGTPPGPEPPAGRLRPPGEAVAGSPGSSAASAPPMPSPRGR